MPIRNSVYGPLALPLVSLFVAACGGGGGGGGGAAIGGGNNPPTSGWLIPVGEVVDGGPGQDGIPSIDRPIMLEASATTNVPAIQRVVGLLHEGTLHAYPYNIMNWHEVVNDSINFDDYVVS